MRADSIKDKTPQSRSRCVHALFEDQVERTPDAIAVVFENEQLTYRELNAKANQLAHYLQAYGVGPEVLVGICVERSLEMIIGLLGILKAGCAYLPLDPSYPRERICLMLGDGELRLMLTLTQKHLRDALPTQDSETICLDNQWDAIARESEENPENLSTPENLAYVIYTSGSTGTPKGVCIPHRAVVRLVKNTNYAQFKSDDIWLQFAPLSFDASTFEIWGSLLNGAKLVIMPPGLATLSELGEVIKLRGITTMWLTAGLFHKMVETELDSLTGVRQLLAGGDVLSVWHVEKVARELKDCQLINGYGPTENTTFTTCYQVRTDEHFDGCVPIGFPISNSQVYILDEDMKATPAGSSGEIYIGGDGLARGYLNDVSLTAERFVPSPFGLPGSRLYRTGDRGRFLGAGQVEFLGRLDQQVKIRGFRVEPGEIEVVLKRHPSVGECVVTARPDQNGDQRLVAYVVHNAEDNVYTKLDSEHLRRWQELYDDTYSQTNAEPTFNIVGWNSSYTGRPIPVEEMREWVDRTTERILSLRPSRVLEIGCGTGLLLFRIAPHCAAYHGTDFSATAIKTLEEQVQRTPDKFANVTLERREANDFDGLKTKSFDVVIMNSVAQYFPRLEYLLRVLEGAVRVTRPGGYVFIGDVRSLLLLETFHASVQLHLASPSLTVDQLKSRVRQALDAEDELVIDPGFFRAVSQRLGCQVRVMPKRGRFVNELTRFRYDVVLQVEPTSPGEVDAEWRNWAQSGLTVELLRNLLEAGNDEVVAISGVPNPRVASEAHLVNLLKEPARIETVSDLRSTLATLPLPETDPENLWTMAQSNSYSMDLSWAESAEDGSFDIVFARHVKGELPAFKPRKELDDLKDLSAYANQPSVKSSTSSLVPELVTFLRGKLPKYMVPSAFVVLDALPLTPNGKVDRRALPPPRQSRPSLEQEFVTPRNRIEESWAGIWAEVLGLDRVGVHDNFFELGGHSLMAMQVASRICEEFQTEIPLRAFLETPTISDLVQLVESDVQRLNTEAISRVTTGPMAPVSFGQERIWFLNQLVPGTPVHNIPFAVPLDYSPDISVLEQTLNEIIRRHDSLRTTFPARNGAPTQLIARSLRSFLTVVDLTQLPQQEREVEAQRMLGEEAHTPFDLINGPLFRAKLVRLTDNDHILLLTLHHIVGDGWSMAVLLREIGQLYQAFSAGKPSPLAELRFQYSDFAIWQREYMQGPVREKQLEYWKQQLAGAPTVLDLPSDHPRPQVQSFRAAREAFSLSKGFSRSLGKLSNTIEATPFMTLLAAFNILLQRYSGQDDILVGSPIVNRPGTDAENLIGFFLNNVVLRTRLSQNISFRELVGQVREVALGAYANQDLPFEIVVDELNPRRDLNRSPLFQVFFNYLNFADGKINLPGLTKEPVSPTGVWSERVAAWSQFDLTLYLRELDEELQLLIVYNSDIFERPRIVAMLEQFASLLEQVVAQPDRRISEYSLLTPGSLAVLPDPTVALSAPFHEPITETFFSRARELPHHPAIVKGVETYTYNQLAEEARSISLTLLSCGLEKGDVVGVSGRPSFGLIASMLGVLSSGGVLLTLDRNLPSERQKLMIREGGAKHVLYVGEMKTNDDWMCQFPSVSFTLVPEELRTSSELPRPVSSSSSRLPELNASDAAYLFFTSGTSGVPKGVLGCHKGLSHFLKWQREEFEITAEDRAAQLTGLSFDVVLRDIFLPLTSGASLHLPDDSTDSVPSNILQWLEREQISILHTVPTLAQSWLNDVPLAVSLQSLRWVFFAGEPLTDSLVRRWREAFPAAGKLVNLYGPTETTLAKCFYVVPESEAFGVQPVGRPLPETQALVLGDNDRLCGISEPGEIVIRTPFRTLGYINAAEEQQRRFIQNPFTDDTNDLIYRTGDRGRYQPDGTLAILGRLDEQIKIRGVRIEPDEVTTRLMRHSSVRSCIVVPCKDSNGENALAAYVVMAKGNHEVGELRLYLGKHLPAAMVPSYFVVMEQLPLTPNGKVDRRKLPNPHYSFTNLKQEFIGPRNKTEETVLNIWSEVLGIERISILNDFFELGGHSLLATQIMSRVRDAFQIELPLSMIFENTTVEAFSRSVAEAQEQGLEVTIPTMTVLPRKRRVER